MKASTPWYVYLIECRDGSLYTGIAVHVGQRYDKHVAGKGARYTRSHPPLRLLGQCAYPDRSEASRAEYRIKQLTPAQKRELCTGWGDRGQNSAHSTCSKPHSEAAQTSVRR